MEYLQQLIDKFWKGEASKKERKFLLRELEQREGEFSHFLWGDYNSGRPPRPAERLSSDRDAVLLGKIHERINLGVQKPKANRMDRWRIAGVAAAVIFLFIAGVLVVQKDIRPTSSSTASITLPQSVIKKNTSDKALLIMLPDGSEVQLAPQASLAYTADFGRTQRRVSLIGDAFFEVKKKAEWPFTVVAKGYSVTALGTVFTVNTSKKGKMHVKLLSGKVLVQAENEIIRRFPERVLKPGDELHIDLEEGRADLVVGNKLQVNAHPVKPSRAAKSLVLHFDDTPLTTVLAQLGSAYPVKFIYEAEALMQKTFTGRLTLSGSRERASLDSILTQLCQRNGLKYNIEKHEVVISKKEQNNK